MFVCCSCVGGGEVTESTDDEPMTSQPITAERSQLIAWQVFTSSWQTRPLPTTPVVCTIHWAGDAGTTWWLFGQRLLDCPAFTAELELDLKLYDDLTQPRDWPSNLSWPSYCKTQLRWWFVRTGIYLVKHQVWHTDWLPNPTQLMLWPDPGLTW